MTSQNIGISFWDILYIVLKQTDERRRRENNLQ